MPMDEHVHIVNSSVPSLHRLHCRGWLCIPLKSQKSTEGRNIFLTTRHSEHRIDVAELDTEAATAFLGGSSHQDEFLFKKQK